MIQKIGLTTDKKGHQPRPELFGNATRTSLLVLVYLLNESYPRELSRLLGLTLSPTQLAIERLQSEGVLATRLIGKTRRVQLNPRYFALAQLRPLLARLAEGFPEYEAICASVRRRPRRRGKPL